MKGERHAEAIARQQWKVLLRNLPAVLIGNGVASLLIGATIWWLGASLPATVWTAGSLGIQVLRYAIWMRDRRAAVAGHNPIPARRRIVVGNILAGAWWGIGLPLVISFGHHDLVTLLGVFISGLVAGSMAATATVPAAFMAFTLPLTLPVAGYMAAHATVTGVALGGAILVFTVLMVSVAFNMARQTRELLEMRAARTSLIRDLADARDRAEASDLAKSRFLATMSHELRTPLNIILGFAQSIEQRLLGPLGDERYAEYAGTIRQSGEHLLTLINDVLDLSRVGAGQYRIEPEKIQVGDIVDEIRRSVSDDASRQKVTVFTTVAPEVPDIWADRRALRQILMNLLSNAIKFTPMGGHVQVSATYDPAEPALRLVVSDSGVGIPADQQDKVLKPFVQADNDSRRRYQGTGLGLALSKELTELQHGRLMLESEEGEGTRVTLALPVVGGTAPAEDIGSLTTRSAGTAARRVHA